MMLTSNLIHKAVSRYVDISIKDICVFNGVIFSFINVYATYCLNKVAFDRRAGFLAALIISTIPGLVSRSHAGSYDYESMAIFQIQLVLLCWLKAYREGSMIWGGLTGLAYFYLNSTWGGYIISINLIAVHAVLTIISGRFNMKIKQAFVSYAAVQTLLSFHVSFAAFSHISSLESIASLIVVLVIVMQSVIQNLLSYVERNGLGSKNVNLPLIIFPGVNIILLIAYKIYNGSLWGLSQRVFSLFDSQFYADNNPLVASVAEHTGSPWQSLFISNGLGMFVAPLGCFLAFARQDPANWIIIVYYLCTSLFAAQMSRLKLLFAPAVSLIGGFAFSEFFMLFKQKLAYSLENYSFPALFAPTSFHQSSLRSKISRQSFKNSSKLFFKPETLMEMVICLIIAHCFYHSIQIDIQSFVYNGITSYVQQNNQYYVNDDVKHAYNWLRQNTHAGTKILSWWDYGYQVAGLTDRTTYIDNYTAFTFEISIVALILSSSEDTAIKYLRALDVDHILVMAPGTVSHGMGDDISKMYWILQISQHGFPHLIDEASYTPRNGHALDVHEHATRDMVNSLLYKTCFFDHEKHVNSDGINGAHPDSNMQIYSAIDNRGVHLKYLEEVYSPKFRSMRLYKVKERSNFVMMHHDMSIFH